MANRVYIVPIVGVGTHTDPRTAKYFGDGTLSATWYMTDYGFEPWGIVVADLSTADHATVVAAADGFALPVNLDGTLSAGNVTTVQGVLETMPLPAGWVTAGMTWRFVLRTVVHISAYMQRLAAITQGTVFKDRAGISLSTTVGDLPVPARNRLAQAATDLGLSTAGVTNATTLRQVLKSIADQTADEPYLLGGLSI